MELMDGKSKTPIYDEVSKKFENLNFMRDDKGKFINVFSLGWYQNSSGDLFHYDGVVWDVVPREQVKNLEYLGE
jgi:hypothetical protein